MDPEKKKTIMEDLRDFADGQSFYQKTGRAWKRGYLLYGPPGTGKSSMIAAMANFLGYDIYDLELTEVHTNSELRKLLMKTSSKSIIVIEDIDCSINLTNRKKTSSGGSSASGGGKSYFDQGSSPEMRSGSGSGSGEDGAGNRTITLSGLLNFTDGLWSCCGSERIFVFTTNHIEKLDPALLRSGRMDMHIFMSYCSFEALKILLKNYLGFNGDDDEVVNDAVLRDLEEVIEKAEMTPADISEVLIKNRRDRAKAVRELLEVLRVKAAKVSAESANRKNGPSSEKREVEEEEEEEQEKRALESPNKDGVDFDQDESCKKGGSDEDQIEEEEEELKAK